MADRVASLAITLHHMSNDALCRIDLTSMAKGRGIARHFVAKMIAEEIKRRGEPS